MSHIPKALRRFLLVYLLLHLLASGCFVWFLTSILRDQMVSDTQSRMSAMVRLLEQHVAKLDLGLGDPSLPVYLENLGKRTHYRFTVITEDGVVVCDSVTGTSDIGPHGDRIEVQVAKIDGIGFSERFSNTLKKQMMYLAIHYSPRPGVEPNGFLRVALPAASINNAIDSLRKLIWSFALFVSLLTALLMVWLLTRTMQPLREFSEAAEKIGIGKYDAAPTLLGRNDEWGSLAEAFRKMQAELELREESLMNNNARLEAVLRSMIEGVIAVDSEDQVILANSAACQMLSLTQSQLVGRKLNEIVRIPELGHAISKTRAKRLYSETEFQTQDSRRTISATVSVLADSTTEMDSTPGVAIVLHDVTELQKLENLRRDFVANVSHELKTPLSSIMAYAETLRMGAIDDREKNVHFLGRIEAQAQMLNQQIQDLLQLARVESGEEVWEIEPVELNNLCEQCIRRFAPEAERQQIFLTNELSSENPATRADAEGLDTIISNLVSNAIHYTPPGGSVTLSTKVDGEVVSVSVEDTGIGIKAKHLERIFERFYRVDKARSRDKGGTGLGLSIVKHLANSFGGNVQVESEPGQGSTFRVSFPKFVESNTSNPG